MPKRVTKYGIYRDGVRILTNPYTGGRIPLMSYSVAEKFARTFSRSHGGRYVAGEVRETVKSGDRARAKRSVRTRRSLDYGELRRE